MDDGKAWPEAQFEIFKLAPGKQESFIRKLAQWDQVSAAGGQPPTQMFIHEENVASHTETKTQGPLSAAQWLARLDAWRAAHPEAAKGQ